MEFLNRTQDKFEWENDDIPTEEVTGEEPIDPNLIAEIPGIELETDYEDIEYAVEETCAPSLADRAADARQNANFKSTGVETKIKGVLRSPNTHVPMSQDSDDDDDDDQPPKMELGYDSSDDEDSNDEPDDAPGRPRPPLIRRSDDDDDTILVEDVLENDESLEDIVEEADVIQKPAVGECVLEHHLYPTKQVLRVNRTRGVHFSKYLSTIMREICLPGVLRNSTRVLHYST